MVSKKRYTRDSYPTYEGRVKETARPKWFIILFVIMIIATAVGFYIYYQYSSIQDAYQTMVYEEEVVPHLGEQNSVEDNTPYTVLLVTLDNIYVDGAQVEEALWSTLYYINPEQSTVQAVNIPLNLVVDNGEEDISLLTYANSGLSSIKDTVERLFEVQLNYLSVIRLQNIRDIIDPLAPINVNVPIDIENLSIYRNQSIQLSGRETMNLIDEGNELPVLDQIKLHQSLLNSIATQSFKLENLLQLPEFFENGEYVFETELPFRKLVEIYRNDDYNLTNVDLNELITLNRTQIDNRYIYFADLEELKVVVSKMASAIDELATKD